MPEAIDNNDCQLPFINYYLYFTLFLTILQVHIQKGNK